MYGAWWSIGEFWTSGGEWRKYSDLTGKLQRYCSDRTILEGTFSLGLVPQSLDCLGTTRGCLCAGVGEAQVYVEPFEVSGGQDGGCGGTRWLPPLSDPSQAYRDS